MNKTTSSESYHLSNLGVQQNHWSSSFGMFWISGPPIPTSSAWDDHQIRDDDQVLKERPRHIILRDVKDIKEKVARKGLKQALPPILFLGAAQPNYFIDTPQLVLDLNFNTFDQESKVDSLGRVKVVSNNLLGGWFWNYLRGMGAYVYSYF